MNRVLGFLLIMVLTTRTAPCQENDDCATGVFVTQADFVRDHLTHKIKTSAKGNTLGFNFPADLTLTLKLVTPDSTLKFPPGSIYGYRECKNVFRFFPGGNELNTQEDYYKVEEATEGFVLYSSEFISNHEIFYSVGLVAPIHRLTLDNLKKDFKRYPKFVAAAEKLKRSTDGLPMRTADGFIIMKNYKETVANKLTIN